MTGPLADHQILELTSGSNPSIGIDKRFIQPSSTDLPIGQVIYHVASEPVLNGEFSVGEFIFHHTYNKFELDKLADQKLTIVPGSTYLVEIDVNLNLPSEIFGCANPKSSTGRNGLHTKLICDNSTEYDFIPRGYKGKLYVSISPRVFPVQLKSQESLVQVRYFSQDRAYLPGFVLEHLHRQDSIVGNTDANPVFTAEGLLLHVNLRSQPAALVANKIGRPIPIWEKNSLDPKAFFREKPLYCDRLFLEPGEFALASTVELIRVPPDLCAEMVPYHPNRGELRWHDAGFIDPAFGYGRGEIAGSSIVLEITNFGTAPAQLSHGQPLGILRFERLCSQPERVYGEASYGGASSHYQGQLGVRLSKNFISWS